MKYLVAGLLLCGVFSLQSAMAGAMVSEESSTKWLFSSSWCSSPLLKSAEFMKLKYYANGTYIVQSLSNTTFCSDGSESTIEGDAASYGEWKVEKSILYTTNDSGKFLQVDPVFKAGTAERKAIVLDGMEYVKCE